MARINIPIDALTSRLRLPENVRSQSVMARFSNLKPLSEFFDLKRVSKPANFNEIQTRVNYNLSYFSSNYAVVFVMLSIYALITNLTLLFLIIFVVGGMWGIGRLGGADLDLGFIRATPSQLYTALFCVAVPLMFIASPFTTVLWLIGATGGGVDGHPRAPPFTPHWGRPSAARPGSGPAPASERRRRNEWTQWEAQNRFEEIDSEVDETGRPFTGDRLLYSGFDMGGGAARASRRPAYEEDYVEYQDDYDELGDDHMVEGGEWQLAMRQKEEELVEHAMRRISRARLRGESDVNLSREEIDALERRQLIPRTNKSSRSPPSAAAPAPKGAAKPKRRSQGGFLGFGGQPKQKPTRKSLPADGSSTPRNQASTPDYSPRLAPASPHSAGYAPQLAPPSRRGTSSPARPGSGSKSSTRVTAIPAARMPEPGSYRPSSSSRGSPPRSLPDDPNWAPRSRSGSSLQLHQAAADPFSYQVAGSSQQIPGRRNVSGPSTVSYSSLRRAPPPAGTMPHPHARNSRYEVDDESDDGEYDDDEEEEEEEEDDEEESDNGVPLALVPGAVPTGYNRGAAPAPAPARPRRAGRR